MAGTCTDRMGMALSAGRTLVGLLFKAGAGKPDFSGIFTAFDRFDEALALLPEPTQTDGRQTRAAAAELVGGHEFRPAAVQLNWFLLRLEATRSRWNRGGPNRGPASPAGDTGPGTPSQPAPAAAARTVDRS